MRKRPRPPPDPIRLHAMRAVEAEGTLEHTHAYLRHLTGGTATRHPDRERQARLRWLLGVLGEMQPEIARQIEAVWGHLRLREQREDGRPCGAGKDYLERGN